MTTKLTQLANKQMDRKEFLQHAGVGLALVAGGGLIARALGAGLTSGDKSAQNSAQKLGYGGSAYGK